MGVTYHEAILVTSWNKEAIHEAHAKAMQMLHDLTGPVVVSPVNSVSTFAVFPDGSKEGWPEAEEAETVRGQFLNWLNTNHYDDGSSNLDWCLVQYGNDMDKPAKLLDHSGSSARRKDRKDRAKAGGK